MGDIQVRIRQNNSSAWGAALKMKVAAEVAASAQRILAAAADRAPVRTGELQSSGTVTQVSDLSYTVSFGDGLPDGRAIYQELGTSKHPAQPYLYPSFQEELPTFLARVAAVTGGRAGSGFSGSSEAEISASADPLVGS